MAPPRTNSAPLLSELDPKAVAVKVCRAVVEHVHRISFALMPGVEARLVGEDGLSVEPEALSRSTDLGLTVQALTLYAQRGLLSGTGPDRGWPLTDA